MPLKPLWRWKIEGSPQDPGLEANMHCKLKAFFKLYFHAEPLIYIFLQTTTQGNAVQVKLDTVEDQ